MSSGGEMDLSVMLKTLTPALADAEYAFCHVPADGPALDPAVVSQALMTFRETEGLTLILDAAVASSSGLAFDTVFSCITLKVHSSLEATGLTAAISKALGDAAIPANVVAAFFHDHVFVPKTEASRAVAVLEELSKKAAGTDSA